MGSIATFTTHSPDRAPSDSFFVFRSFQNEGEVMLSSTSMANALRIFETAFSSHAIVWEKRIHPNGDYVGKIEKCVRFIALTFESDEFIFRCSVHFRALFTGQYMYDMRTPSTRLLNVANADGR